MKRIYSAISSHSERVQHHPLFNEIAAIPDAELPYYLKLWAPLFVHLALTFRDINTLYFAYQPPANAYEREINAHAEIDSTHWRFLLSDLHTLEVNNQVNDYEQAIARIWSEEGLPIRHYMYSVVARAQACGLCPLLRASVMESGEATVKLFFSTTRLVAQRFEKLTGKKMHYFGDTHILSETENPVDCALFSEVVIPDTTADKALALVNQHFDNFNEFLNHKYLLTFGRPAP